MPTLDATAGLASAASQYTAIATWNPGHSADTVAWYDFGDTANMFKGSHSVSASANRYFIRTASTPVSEANYPFWMACWFRKTATGATTEAPLVEFYKTSAGGNNRFRTLVNTQNKMCIEAIGSDGTIGRVALPTGITSDVGGNGVFRMVIAVFSSVDSRAIYTDLDPSGTTDSSSVGVSGVNAVIVGRDENITAELNGDVGRIWVFRGNGPDSTQRSLIFGGTAADSAYGSAPEAYWKMDEDWGVDSSGNGYNLTATATPTLNKFIYVLHDKSGNGRHLRCNGGAVSISYVSTYFANHGGSGQTISSHQLLLQETFGRTVPVSIAPFQTYAAVWAASNVVDHNLFALSSVSSVTPRQWWSTTLNGTITGDKAQAKATDSAVGEGAATTANTFINAENALVWGFEASDSERYVQLNKDVITSNTTPITVTGSIFQLTVPGQPVAGSNNGALVRYGGLIFVKSNSLHNKSKYENYLTQTFSLGLPLTYDMTVPVAEAPDALLFGNATVASADFAGAEMDGAATLSAGTFMEQTGTAGLEAVATLSGAPSGTLAIGAGLIANAIQGGFPTQQITASARALSSAEIFAYLDQFRYQSVNPALSGASVPVTNQSRFLLTVNTTPVSLASPYYNMEELFISYDRKSLSFSEIATPGIGHPTFSPEGNVKLQIDFNDGDGLITYFTGQINRRTHEGVNHAEAIRYQAEGIHSLANRVTLLNTTGFPVVTFTIGTTVLTIVGSTEIVTTFAKTVRNGVLELFTAMSSMLNANSISSDIYTPSLDLLNADVPETVTFTNVGFAAAIQQLVNFDKGKRLYWDDTIQKWTFVDLVKAPTIISRVESSQISNLTYDISTEGRFTAIRLMSNESGLDDNLRTGAETLVTPRGTFNLTLSEVTLEPKWNPVAAEIWSIWKVESDFQVGNEVTSDYWWPYRRWSIPNSVLEAFPGTPIRLYAEFQEVPGDETTTRWRKFNGKANFKYREVIANYPVLHDLSDPYIGGDKVSGPSSVKMAYYPRGAVVGTIISSVTTAGTEVSVTTIVDDSLLLDQIRYPYEGYEGTAYDLFNVRREFIDLVSPTEITTANAEARLSLLKDVVINGDIPFAGDPIKSYMNLGAKVRVQHNVNQTGIASFDGYFMEFRYQFGRPGSNYVRLTTDNAAVIG